MKKIILLGLCILVTVSLSMAYTAPSFDDIPLILDDLETGYSPPTFSDIPLILDRTAAVDTCTYTSGTWNIDCSDNCDIAATDLGGNDIIINQSSAGQGNVTFAGNLTNVGDITISGFNSSDICVVTCESGNCIHT